MPSQRKGGPAFAAGWEGRALAGAMWPGITAGMDSRCSCTRAPGPDGVYQVKVRDTGCLNHGGELGAVLARMARWGVRGGD